MRHDRRVLRFVDHEKTRYRLTILYFIQGMGFRALWFLFDVLHLLAHLFN